MRPDRVLCLSLALGACARAPTDQETPARAGPSTIGVDFPQAKTQKASAGATVPRIGALDARVYVRQRPSATSPEIGVIHLGESVRLKAPQPVGTNGCAGGWHSVEPEGFVCLDPTTTLDVGGHPVMRAKRKHRGKFGSARPFRWAESRETPLYRKLPDEREQRASEYELERHLSRVKVLAEARQKGTTPARVHRSLADVDPSPARASTPGFFESDAYSPWSLVHSPSDKRPRVKTVPPRSAIAFTDEFVAGGRSWVLTDDLLLAPKDKVATFSPSEFHGVHLDGERMRLPIVFVKAEARPKYRLVLEPADDVEARLERGGFVPVRFEGSSDSRIDDEEDPLFGFLRDERKGVLEVAGETFSRLASFELTGRVRRHKGIRYVETNESEGTPGRWIREVDATIVQAQAPRGFELAAGEKWIDVSIFAGTLVAYEGDRAVFATLISPGANGYKRIDGEPAKYTTPTGTFRIEWKHLTTTMTPHPDRPGYYLSEVPFTQFFHMPFAFHAAYWHDRFGEPKSGGCVNLSPEDAKWLFGWTLPAVPDGWHAVRSGDGRGAGTLVRVR